MSQRFGENELVFMMGWSLLPSSGGKDIRHAVYKAMKRVIRK